MDFFFTFSTLILILLIVTIQCDHLQLESKEDIDLSFVIPQYGNIQVIHRIECRERKSQSLSWLHHDNFYGCINLVADMAVPSCLYEQLERNGLMYMNKDTSLFADNIHHQRLRRSKCSSFMMLTQDLHFLNDIFGVGRQLFRPFTNIFLFVPSNMTIPEEIISRSIRRGYNLYRVQNRFFDRSLPYFSLNYWYLTNILTNNTMYTIRQNEQMTQKFFGRMRDHPLFDKSVKKSRPFRIGAFHCPPNVIIRDAKKKQ